jgi:hypothetical protein
MIKTNLDFKLMIVGAVTALFILVSSEYAASVQWGTLNIQINPTPSTIYQQ